MSELPNRKPTRLEGFDYSSDGAYFLTVCTKEHKNILSRIISVGDGALDVPKIELTDIGKVVERYILSTNNIANVTVDSYVIMPNHIHMIVFISSEALGTSKAPSPTKTNEIIPHIISTFKRFCNKEIEENIFQRSYNDHIIRDREDYETRRKYIYENPLRWHYNQTT